MQDLHLIAINLTRRCNLACDHCYMDASTRLQGGSDELHADEVKRLLSELAQRSTDSLVVMTGGEPLLRTDLEEMIAHGRDLGLTLVVGTNGVLLNAARVASLKAAGVMGLGISIDSLDPAYHDRFRGRPGSWQKTLAGLELCRQAGLPFQVHFSITEQNADQLPGMIDFAKAVGAQVLNIFFLVCTGRGEGMSDITPQRYEAVLEQLAEAEANSQGLIIRARCAPHFLRVSHQRDANSPLTRAQGYEGGCLAGTHYCRITPEGEITACPYIPDPVGSLRTQPFWQIWDSAPGLELLRQPKLEGNCGICEYRQLCGGCRARPLAMGEGLMASDPWCSYQPAGEGVIPLPGVDQSGVEWTAEAEQRLARIPGFVRKMVRRRAEAHVLAQGAQQVTAAVLEQLAQARFGGRVPFRRPGQDE